GTARIHQVSGDAFIEIPPRVLKEWQRIGKRCFDVLFSLTALILLLPVFALVAMMIRMEGTGPVFYSQERLGQYGRPFRIIKFRSMVVDAEKTGPALSSDSDKRITRAGKWMRKYRIDELPQFINVLKGEMSIVGPRAERKFYADQILAVAPYYTHVLRVQPGITSLGMVKYGYASNVEEMVRRLRYDIIYMENMGFLMDLKILIYTIRTVLGGKGK
ncbi:MAG: sugar transferase, partial [Bacteroidetes bacterium]|nr:sugar transferase [Bacteroidota bacterium]